jgi:hypothetical protein
LLQFFGAASQYSRSAALFGLFFLALSACATVALADAPLACRQIGSVASMSVPVYNPDSTDIQVLVGDHYWACPCGTPRRLVGDSEQRKLVGDSEQRKLVGDSEQRKLVGDSEQRKLVGDSEQRKLVGDSEQRKLVGDSEQRKLVGDSEQRKLVGASGSLQCLKAPGCAGFTVLGANIAGLKVAAHDGLRSASAACVIP